MAETNEPVRIDSEFKELIPPISSDEYKQLEENCKRDGILDSLKTWNGILIDGHNRYEISEKWDLNYTVEEMDFPDRNAVVRWIILNQFGRRNLSAYDRSILALKLKPIIAEKAREKETERKTTYQKSEKSNLPQIDTTKELAKVAGVSHDTIHKVEVIEKSGSEPLKQQVQTGEKSISQAYNEIRNKEIRKPPSAKEYRNLVQERHDDFKAQKVTTIEAVKQDKEDKKLLGDEIRRDIQKSVDGISKLYTMIIANEIDISLMDAENKNLAIRTLRNAEQQIVTILKKVGGVN